MDPILARAISRINEAIADSRVTQKQIAERSKLTQGHVSKVLAGKTPEVAFSVVVRIAMALELSLDGLVEPPRKLKRDETPRPPASSVVPSSRTG